MSQQQPRKIALFLPSLEGGGAERVMVTLANGFAGHGLSVDLVLGQARGPYLAEVSRDVRVVDLGVSRVLAGLPGLHRYLRRERPGALLATLPHCNLVATAAKRLARSPVHLVLREASVPGVRDANARGLRDSWMPRLMAWFYPMADAVVAVSGGVADELAQISGVPRQNIQVIFNPVVTRALASLAGEPLRHPWFTPGAPPVVLGVGRLVELKGFQDLIQAHALLRSNRDVRLVILGEGPKRGELENMVRALGLQDSVSLPGFASNPCQYMQAAGVFVLPSHRDGLPGSLIQAMACGARVVSTDCPGGSAEILENGRWGRLVPTSSPPRLARAIAATLDDPAPPDVRHRANCFAETVSVNAYLEVLGATASVAAMKDARADSSG